MLASLLLCLASSAALTTDYVRGMNAYFGDLNKRGGIRGESGGFALTYSKQSNLGSRFVNLTMIRADGSFAR